MRIWADIEQDATTCACVVLTGAGERAFCVGADMKNTGNKTGLEYWAARAARRLRRHRAARDARRAGDRPGQRLRARRRLRDGARLRHRRRLRGGELRPARAAGRPAAARRRHDAAAAPDPVPPGDGHAADRPARAGAPRRWSWASSTRSCRAPSSTTAVERWVDDILACAPLSLRAIKQVVRRDRRRCRRARPRRCACRRWSRRCSRGSRTRACAPSSEKRAPQLAGPLMTYVITTACID